MIKKEIKHCLVLVVMFFSFMNITHAGVFINEVQMNPTDRRFIELYNNSGGSVDLTNWYIQRKTASGTFGSMVTKTNFEGKSIDAGGYFLISKSGSIGADIVLDTLTLTDSNTIQLKDGSGNVVDKVGWGDTNDCQSPCVENPTSGQSISRNSSGSFIVASPTPGAVNNGEESGDTTGGSSLSSSGSSGGSISNNNQEEIIKPKIIEVPKIITKIIAPKIVTAGVPFEIDHNTTGINKEKIILGKFIWNFGDGRQKQLSVSDAFNYVYDYPGEYVITLSYSDSNFDTKSDATDRITIKVISSGIIISSVGTYADPFVELENKSNYEMAISGWILKGSTNIFVIPEGTVILSNKKLKLSPKITGFNFNDLSFISIIDISGQVFATYPNYVKPITKYSSSNTPKENNTNFGVVKSESIENKNIDKTGDIGNTENVINLNDLGASVASASDPEGTGNINTGINNKTLIYLGLIGIIIIGALGIVLLRPKPEIPDYIDKEITANDMKIIE